MSLTPASVQRWSARVLTALTLVFFGYGLLRYRVERVPEAARTPLFEVSGGDTLLLDRWASDFAPGDILLFSHGVGLHLGRVAAPPPDGPGESTSQGTGLWVEVDRPELQTPHSGTVGPVPVSAVRGRLVARW